MLPGDSAAILASHLDNDPLENRSERSLGCGNLPRYTARHAFGVSLGGWSLDRDCSTLSVTPWTQEPKET